MTVVRQDHRIDEEWEAQNWDSILARTTALFADRGEDKIVSLLIDVRTMTFGDGSEVVGMQENPWTHVSEDIYNRAAILDVDDHLVARFSASIRERVCEVLAYVADRHGEPDVTEVKVRPSLPDIVGNWRETLAQRLSSNSVSNQARRERHIRTSPVEDGLSFGSSEELTLYEVLKKLQLGADEDRTIAILPSAGARLRAGHTWTPDFVILGNGRAVVIEVDGPHHRGSRRVADDKNRDLHWQRCGVPTVRLPVEDFSERESLRARVVEELRRHLWR